MLKLKLRNAPTELHAGDVIRIDTEKFKTARISIWRGNVRLVIDHGQLDRAETFLKNCVTLTYFHKKTRVLRHIISSFSNMKLTDGGTIMAEPDVYRQALIVIKPLPHTK